MLSNKNLNKLLTLLKMILKRLSEDKCLLIPVRASIQEYQDLVQNSNCLEPRPTVILDATLC